MGWRWCLCRDGWRVWPSSFYSERAPQGIRFHVDRSLIAVATSGMTDMGLMEGKQKLFYLPEPAIDFIYVEELGLIDGANRYIFGWRRLRTLSWERDAFGRYLAVGVTPVIVVQVLFNIRVGLVLPTKGIPLPFISYGEPSCL